MLAIRSPNATQNHAPPGHLCTVPMGVDEIIQPVEKFSRPFQQATVTSRSRIRMHHPTDDLRKEHSLLAQAMAVLAGIRRHVQAGGDFPTEDTAEVLRFLREFLIGNHFRKENEVVWPAIAMHGSSEAAAAVGDTMRIQAEVAELVGTLVFFWEPSGELTDVERTSFVDTVAALLARVQQMQRSETQLLSECERAVPGDDQVGWNDEFRTAESRSPASLWRAPVARLALRWAG